MVWGKDGFKCLISFKVLVKREQRNEIGKYGAFAVVSLFFLCFPTLASRFICVLSPKPASLNTTAENFRQEIPAALQLVVTDNCSPVPRPGRQPSQTAGVSEGSARLNLAGPEPLKNEETSL